MGFKNWSYLYEVDDSFIARDEARKSHGPVPVKLGGNFLWVAPDGGVSTMTEEETATVRMRLRTGATTKVRL